MRGSGKIDLTDVKVLYNFTYRLSGNGEIAQVLTEEVLLLKERKYLDKVNLLKCAWEKYLELNKSQHLPQDRLQNALAVLIPEARCAVVLRDVLGYSYEQIGIVLNKSKQEVAAYISVGRQNIKEIVS